MTTTAGTERMQAVEGCLGWIKGREGFHGGPAQTDEIINMDFDIIGKR